ncbi:MAG: hypothetical protein J7641_11485 [Cyanobacteria bacterium SID2]|nr:hypothetical protein [Cyanobacteria bacterium SID2]MBP0005799.1 hypothetical protein [Cyanobacteria bacterium SBC]
MASETQVKDYLAHWFQLGKKIVIGNMGESRLPEPIFEGNRYSQAFEDCWQLCLSPESGDCYLEGTLKTVADLLASNWEIVACARCQMPVPMPLQGLSCLECPCHDLPSWPNEDLPKPRLPINTQVSLREICSRLIELDDED